MSVLTLPVTLPDHDFAKITLSAQHQTARTTSPFSYHSQVFVHSGQRWMADVDLPLQTRADAEAWLAILMELAGGAGEIHLGDPAGAVPRGTANGTPLVDGASQTGQQLDTKGWTPSQTGVLLAGDYIEIGSGTSRRLYKIVADADADGTGLATLKIWPRLRESPSDGAAISTSDTRGTFEIPPQDFGWQWQPPTLTSLKFHAVEAI